MKDVFIDFNIKLGIEKLQKWRYWIAGITVAAGIVAFIACSPPIMKPQFMSKAAFVPPLIESLTSNIYSANGQVGYYVAEEEDLDRTTEYLCSREVMDSVNQRFHLMERYGFNPAEPYDVKAFHNTFNGNIEIHSGDNSTVTITIYDEDPTVAADIANYYLILSENFFERISNREQGLVALNNKIDSLEAVKAGILDSLAILRSKYKVYNFEGVFGENYTSTLLQKSNSNADYPLLYDKLKYMILIMDSYEDLLSDLYREKVIREKDLVEHRDLIQVTEHGVMTPYKERPKRLLIVIMSMFGALLFSLLVVLVVDRPKTNIPV